MTPQTPPSMIGPLDRIPKPPPRLLNDLMAQLYLLREALINSTRHPIYYKELANKLRLLIYEQPGSRSYKPLLLILADQYNVQHSVFLTVMGSSQEYPFPTPGSGLIEFRKYLQLWVFGKKDHYITGSQLVADVANQIGGAHEDLDHVEYLRPVSPPFNGIPYLLEVMQQIAIYTLEFGAKVVHAVTEALGCPPNVEQLGDEPLAPSPTCTTCGSNVGYAEFVCHGCGTLFLQRTPQPPLAEKLRSMFKVSEGVARQTGMAIGSYSIPGLFDRSLGEGILLDYTEGDVSFSIIRTADFRLAFKRTQKDKSLTAQIDLSPVPPTDWILLALTWSPNSVGLYLGSDEQLFSDEVKGE